jgi:O-antigen ligase
VRQKKVQYNNDPFVVSKKHLRSITFFWYGFTIFTIAAIFILIGNKYFNGATCQAIQVVALSFMVIGATDLMKYKFDDPYLKNMFTIYFIYSLTVVARGIQLDFASIKTLLLDGGAGILPYLAPLVVLLPRNLSMYKKLFTTLLIFGGLFILFDIAYYEVIHNPDWMNLESQLFIEVFVGALAAPAAFLLSVYLYNNKFTNIFTAVVILVAVYFLIYRARRGSLALCLTSVAAAGIMYLVYTKRTALVIFISIILISFNTIFLSGIKLPGMFTFLMARKDEDTRSGVEDYMRSGMQSKKDWLIGKGINGTYFCPFVMDLETQSYERPVIETGYLQIILKGGIISLTLLLLILIPAVYKGFFDSKNIFSKAAAMYVLLWIMSLYPTIANDFSMKYVFLWVTVGICYSKKIRGLSDDIIKDHFKRLR